MVAAENEEFDEFLLSLPDWCLCPVSGEVMKDPVIVDSNCLHTLSRESLEQWVHGGIYGVQTKHTCPLCSTPLRSTSVLSSPNVPLRDAIHDFFRFDHNRVHYNISVTKWRTIQSELGVVEPVAKGEVQSFQVYVPQHSAEEEQELESHDFVQESLVEFSHGDGSMEEILLELGRNVSAVRQEMCFEEIANRLRDDNSKEADIIKMKLVNQGLVSLVLRTMRDHWIVSNVQQQGFRVLRCLPFWNESNAKAIVKAKGIPLVLKLMKWHREVSSIQHYSCWFLYGVLSMSYPLIASETAAQISAAAENALRYHSDDEGVNFEAERLTNFVRQRKHQKDTLWSQMLGIA